MSLYAKYRPNNLSEYVGNEEVVADLKPFIRGKRDWPKAILFTGPSGVGKTTISRICAKRMGCPPQNIYEMDTADFRGIDSIRDIRRQMALASISEGNRCWILDECFEASTPVNTPDGAIPISEIQKDQPAYSAIGLDKVKRKMTKKVKLKDLCLVKLGNKKQFLVSKNHSFFTSDGWVHAGVLDGKDVAVNPKPDESYFLQLPAYGMLYYTLMQGIVNRSTHVDLGRGGRERPYYELFNRVVSVTPFPAERWMFESPAFDKTGWEPVTKEVLEKGFIEFYDLEMTKHHSYYVDNVLVHNCHKLTNDAQNALLKALENPPLDVFFILCTTDPQLLLKTIITRCTNFKLNPLAVPELVQVLQNACMGEGADVSDDVLKAIARGANGSPRQALSTLERVLARKPEDYENAIETMQAFDVQIKDLCQALIKAEKWKSVAGIIKALEEEPETIRRAILGYMNAVLLSGKDSARAAYVLDCFKEPYFNTGQAGLTLSCYAALMQE